jgi:rubrerythrin
MAKAFKGSMTEKNLLASFAGESQARNRYTFFASQAKKEGFEQISAIFTETAANEKEHAERFFKFLQGGPVQIHATYPAGVIGTTAENLKAAAEGEREEHFALYPNAAKIAENEGFADIAEAFRRIASVEKHHEMVYLALLSNIERDKVFKKDKVIKWKCRNCGYVYEGNMALDICPACLHSKAYAEELKYNF